MGHGASGRYAERILPIVAIGIVILVLAHQAAQLVTRFLDPDELQHSHSAWCVSQGMVPYADFFEHHTPALSYLLASVLSLLEVESSADNAITAIFLARFLMWLMTLSIVALTFLLSRTVWDRATAWAAVVFLTTTLMFQAKALEIRPDLFSATFLLISFVLVARASRSPASKGSTSWRMLVLAGLAAGIAVLFTQNALFALPGLEQKRGLRDDLRSGRIAPQIVALDDDLAYLSEEVTAFVGENYTPAGVGPIWVRNEELTSNMPLPSD